MSRPIIAPRQCVRCQHDMTEAGKGSIAYEKSCCMWCSGLFQMVGGSRHDQADHDEEGLANGNLREATAQEAA